ncbi:MAG: endonuclease/exonuclease/phosphatase family protein, partial [Verrucomicrobiota bacterium]
YFAHFNPGSGFRAVVFSSTSGAASGSFRLGVANSNTSGNANSGQLTNNLSLNQNYFLVIRYAVATGSSTIWLNPVSESDASVTATDTVTTASVTAFSFRQTGGEGIMTIDDLRIGTAFADVTSPDSVLPPNILTQPQSQTVFAGATANFSVGAEGAPLSYQWKFNGTNISGANLATFSLTNVMAGDAGDYSVTVSNNADSTNSAIATLTVNETPPTALTVLTYNTHGNMIADWSTNSLQVRAIGRQMSYLNPDVITFQEIPATNSSQMTNFVKAFLPGYFLATNSGTDGFGTNIYIRSVIASRYPITRSKSWLDGAQLEPWGYTNSNFTRDLFEAEIAVPGFLQPLHVFTTHLKSGASSSDDSAKRAAEASAISNYFVTSFLTTNASHPYLLTGDLNEDISRPSTGSQQPIQRLVNAATGLQLTTPLNPITGSELTFSIQAASLTKRYDYILPGGLLFSNIVSSQIFRTDLLSPVPSGVLGNDDQTASDHLPVMMSFANPYATPFRISSITWNNQFLTLNWESSGGRQYRVESSTTLTNWAPFSGTILATGTNLTFSTNVSGDKIFLRVYRFP